MKINPALICLLNCVSISLSISLISSRVFADSASKSQNPRSTPGANMGAGTVAASGGSANPNNTTGTNNGAGSNAGNSAIPSGNFSPPPPPTLPSTLKTPRAPVVNDADDNPFDSDPVPGHMVQTTPTKGKEGNSGDNKLRLGDYVELDDAIKNEMYGTIDFPNAELKDIIKAISKLANKNFILDRKIENRRVTILSPQPVTKQEAYNAFLSALYMNDLTVVSMGKFLKVIEAKAALQSNIRVFIGDYAPQSEEIVTLLYQLKYLNADEIQRFLTDLVPRNGRIASYPNTNTLVMTDTGLNLRRVIAILKSIDVPGHEDELESIPIRYANAKGISQLIEDILSAQSGSRSNTSSRGAPQKTRGGGIITKIVPDDRTNSLVVLANGRGVQELRNLVAKLDTPDAAGGGNIHIYFCKNAVAEELATTINGLVSGTSKTATTGANNNNANNQNIPAPPSPIGATAGSGANVHFDGNIKVTADKPTNSLVVIASGSDFAALKNVLKQLDLPRRQVYVEGTIMEINVENSRNLSVGVNIAAPGLPEGAGFVPSTISGPATLGSMLSTPAGVQGLVGAITAGASNVSITNPTTGLATPIPSVLGLVQAIEDLNMGQILHQPQILTSDNQEAEIKVTQKVPYLQSTTTLPSAGTAGASSAAVSQSSYAKDDIVVSLKITPQLGVGTDLVKLKVDQSVDDFSTVGGGQHEINERKATTSVVVRDSDTVVVGGLQKVSTSDVRSKFPLLGDIPIIGALFRGSSSDHIRSNLILFLTPHIINEYRDLLRITGNKIKDRVDFGRKQTDPHDALLGRAQEFQKLNEEQMQRPPPKNWGFKPASLDDDTPSTSPGATSGASLGATPGSATASTTLPPPDARATTEMPSTYLEPDHPPRAAAPLDTTAPLKTTTPTPPSALTTRPDGNLNNSNNNSSDNPSSNSDIPAGR